MPKRYQTEFCFEPNRTDMRGHFRANFYAHQTRLTSARTSLTHGHLSSHELHRLMQRRTEQSGKSDVDRGLRSHCTIFCWRYLALADFRSRLRSHCTIFCWRYLALADFRSRLRSHCTIFCWRYLALADFRSSEPLLRSHCTFLSLAEIG